MEQHIKLIFMNLMNLIFDSNVNLKFYTNLEVEMIKLPDFLSQLLISLIHKCQPGS